MSINPISLKNLVHCGKILTEPIGTFWIVLYEVSKYPYFYCKSHIF